MQESVRRQRGRQLSPRATDKEAESSVSLSTANAAYKSRHCSTMREREGERKREEERGSTCFFARSFTLLSASPSVASLPFPSSSPPPPPPPPCPLRSPCAPEVENHLRRVLRWRRYGKACGCTIERCSCGTPDRRRAARTRRLILLYWGEVREV